MISKDYRNIVSLLGRLLLGLIFLVSAVRTTGQFQASVADLAQNHIPLAGISLAIALTAELLGAIFLVSGLWYRWGALLLILFLVPATLLYHAFWLYEGARRDAQLVHFLKNLAILGGLALVAADRIRTNMCTRQGDLGVPCSKNGGRTMHYLLFYEVGDDYVSRRAEFREAHLTKVWEASERGELLLAGALANPVDGAVLLFKGDSSTVAENFARNDPYVASGAVKRWYVREWTTVAGEDAAVPIKPSRSEAAREGPIEFSSQHKGMILRMWRARSTIEKADEYVEHATTKVFPALCAIEGHHGAYLLRRAIGNAVELVVLTLWKSMDAVRKFAGTESQTAVVDPEAQAMLADFDRTAAHFEIVHAPEDAARGAEDRWL